jgi:pimeloyl-ACP methyl ester carboxylesterase
VHGRRCAVIGEDPADLLRAPTVVFVPGLGLGAEAVLPAIRHGSAHWASEIALLPGYGMPVPRGLDVSPVALADRLVDLLRVRGLRRAVLVGHSASCQLAVEAAVRDPGAVAGLVLLGPTTDPRAATWPRLASRWLRTAAREPPWQVPLLVRMYTRTGLRGMAAAMDAARRHDLRGPLERVSVPTAVVRGRHDRIAPPRWVTDVAALAGGSATALPTGGHMVVLTHPATVVPVITQIVRVASGPPATS